ncbi:MAG: hypothetical protein ACP5DC_10595, partial [Halothiobacillaceae bacterium]
RLRVHERGAGETLACGTGACAAVAVGIRQGLLDDCCQVRLPGGELVIRQTAQGQLLMTGPAVTVFEGRLIEPPQGHPARTGQISHRGGDGPTPGGTSH